MDNAKKEHWRANVRVPRRAQIAILIQNYFHYIVSCLVILGIASIAHLSNLLPMGFGLGILFLAAVIFWEGFLLELEKEREDHPHHGDWNIVLSILKYPAKISKKIPSVAIAFTLWLFATGMLITLRTLYLEQTITTWVIIQAWVLFLPSLWVISWNIKSQSSEWFLLISVMSIIVFAWVISSIDIEDQNIIMISQSSWMLLAGGIVHSLSRKLSFYEGQNIVSHGIIQELRENPAYLNALEPQELNGDPDPILNNLAEDLATTLGYNRVFIVLVDQKSKWLFLKGSNISDSELLTREGWPSSGWRIGDGSITGWVAEHSAEHLCQNSGNCKLYFHPPGFEQGFKVGSEIAVPILVNEKCIGVLDVESPWKGSFSKGDIHLLWQIANAIGGALSHRQLLYRKVSETYQLFENAAAKLYSSRDFTEALGSVVETTRNVFNADLATLYRHAMGTHLPLPHLIWKGNPLDKDYLDVPINPDNRIITSLLKSGKADYFISNADSEDGLLGPNKGEYTPKEQALYGRKFRFIKREQIKSSSYVSLGFGDNIVGSLFLNYRERTIFSEDYKERLRAFRTFMSLALLLRQQVDRFSGPLSGIAPISHSKAEVAFAALRTTISKMTSSNSECTEPLLRIREKVDNLKRGWMDLVLAEPEDFSIPLSTNLNRLKDKMSRLITGMQSVWEVDNRIDRIPIELQEVAYKIIAEAISNAIFHGEATNTQVFARLEPGKLLIQVQNQGIAMSPEDISYLNSLDYAKTTLSEQSGIKALLMDAQKWFGAEWEFASHLNESILLLTIPLFED